MKTFFINTVTQLTTVAIYADNEVLAENRWTAEMNEAEKLQPEVEKLLESVNLGPDDIGRLIVCTGPGGFTSSRIGVSAINAWAFAKNIPVATVSIFDLYNYPNVIVLVSTNENEAWIKLPGHDPKFITCEQFAAPAGFLFGGIVHEEWKKYLEKQGGKYEELQEQLPNPGKLEFSREIVKPWYYKDANITWSGKIRK